MKVDIIELVLIAGYVLATLGALRLSLLYALPAIILFAAIVARRADREVL